MATSQMFTKGVHHVSINVDDVAACRDFYVDTLGFEPIERPDLGIGGVWLQMGPQELHLVELPLVEGFGPHFAIAVDDIDEARKVLLDRGVDVGEPSPIDGVCLQAFFHDPAGNQIELNQRI
ncbi:MAG: VOC family protein [Acidimicrobiales bacterium]|nr:MAG: VOC family protein [Acidimicrobiales bacterium]